MNINQFIEGRIELYEKMIAYPDLDRQRKWSRMNVLEELKLIQNQLKENSNECN